MLSSASPPRISAPGAGKFSRFKLDFQLKPYFSFAFFLFTFGFDKMPYL
jgi:hypothetical protein